MGFGTPMDERAQKTERAAKRLIKSEARRYVYQALSGQVGGVAYTPMVALEDAIIEEATLVWREAYGSWAPDDSLSALLLIIEKVALESYRDCQDIFEESISHRMAQAKLKEFFEKFDAKGLLQ